MKVDMELPGLLGLAMLWVIFFSIAYALTWKIALHWLLLAGLLWSWVWYTAYKLVDLNRVDAKSPLLKTWGWANRITLLRGYLIAATGGFLFQPEIQGFMAWAPGLLYGLAAILDRVDGFVARKSKQTTLLGAELDTAFDALGLLIAPLLAISLGKIHWSYFLLSLAFYIFQWGLYWRRSRGLAVDALLPSPLRRALAGFQMGFIALALLPCFQIPQTITCGFAFMIPALLGFTLDWLVVSGRIKSGSIKTIHFFDGLTRFSRNIFQPALRIFISVGVLLLMREMDSRTESTDSNIFLALSFMFGASLVLLGFAGRIGAFIIVLLLSAISFATDGLSIAVLCSAAWLMLLGTGRFSLWQWDDMWVNRQDGAREPSAKV